MQDTEFQIDKTITNAILDNFGKLRKLWYQTCFENSVSKKYAIRSK